MGNDGGLSYWIKAGILSSSLLSLLLQSHRFCSPEEHDSCSVTLSPLRAPRLTHGSHDRRDQRRQWSQLVFRNLSIITPNQFARRNMCSTIKVRFSHIPLQPLSLAPLHSGRQDIPRQRCCRKVCPVHKLTEGLLKEVLSDLGLEASQRNIRSHFLSTAVFACQPFGGRREVVL